MGAIVFPTILTVIAAAAIVVGIRMRKADKASLTPKILMGVGGLIAAVAVVITALGTFYTQDPGEAVVVKSFTGEVVGSTPDAGLHTKAPWHSTVEFNIRNQKIEMYSNDGGVGADGSALNVPLQKGANATVSITVTYSINASKVEDIYNEFKDQDGLKNNALNPQLRSVVRNETAKLAPLQIKEGREALGTAILGDLTTAWTKYGIVVEQVSLGDITLDKNTEEAISKVITAQQGVEEARANLEKARITAEATKVDASAQADADQIIRCGAKTQEVVEKVNGVDTKITKAIPLTGSKCQNRLNEQVLTSKYIDALKEIAGKQGNVIITDGKSVPMVQVPPAK